MIRDKSIFSKGVLEMITGLDFGLQLPKKMLYKFGMILLILGALNWGFIGIFRINPVQNLLGRTPLPRFIYGAIGIAALFVMFHRDFYLPFLGETVMPCSVLREKIPEGAQISVKVGLNPGQKVLFWATEPATEHLKTIATWSEAYLGYENAGVTTADQNGVAHLRVRPPQAYTVPTKGRLEPHVHYRVCQGNGFLGPVQTVFINDGSYMGAAAGPASGISENFLYRMG